MVATSKQELLAVCTKEFDKLEKLLVTVEPEMALARDDEDTSIKDVVGHRARWVGLFLGWYEDGLAGKEVFLPAEGYKWNELKRYNADLRSAQSNLGWDDAVSMLRGAQSQLGEFIEGHSNEELYSAPMVGAKNHWTPGRWAEAAGPSHYRSAAKYVRATLRSRSAR